MKTIDMTGKTVEDAVQAACKALGVDRYDENVSYEILEMPVRRLFKSVPAKIRLTVTEPESLAVESEAVTAKAAELQETVEQAAVMVEETAAPVQEEPKAEAAAPVKPAAAPVAEDAEEKPLDLAGDARLSAAVDYLSEIFRLMGVENFSFTAVQKGEATILKVTGEHMGVLIGRRGETMESLSYLASLVVNRMEGPYVKLGIDVGGYRTKREDDLAALAKRICERVIRTGCYYEMEVMNPYERHIIHTAVSEVEGVRSESKGEGNTRHVVIYSTDPNASNLPDREAQRRNRSAGRRDGGRPQHGGRSFQRDSRGGSRPPRGDRRSGRGGPRSGGRGYGAPHSSVPEREFANIERSPDAKPMAPKTNSRIHDGDDFAFGKIDF